MQKIRNRNIFIRDKLVLETFLIGYKNLGESIVFIIFIDGEVGYSGVIDCYEYNSLNKTVDILEENGIDALDFICWTHPDEDHSVGIDILTEDYADERTKIYLPEDVNGNEYNYNKRIENTFNNLDDILKSRKLKKYSVKSASDKKELVYKTFEHGVRGNYEFTIYSIAPNSTIVRGNKFNKTFAKNDYSIGLILNIGEFSFLFSGDIENKTISKMEYSYFPEVIDYIKTPHHTSNSSDKLLEYLNYDSKSELACTTVVRRSNLPDKEVIEKYKNYSRSFYSTGAVDKDDKYDYGIINVKCDVMNKKMTTRLEGNSEQVFEL